MCKCRHPLRKEMPNPSGRIQMISEQNIYWNLFVRMYFKNNIEIYSWEWISKTIDTGRG